MKGKKKEENVDITNLPKINTFTSSLIFSSENLDKRMKLLETIFKSNHKFIRLVTRENLIEFAKERGIFVEAQENKKDPNPVDKRDINSDELAKAAAAIIMDRAIPMMREKKTLMDKIEELKKQKEEAIHARDHPQPVDPKKQAKPADKNKPVIVNPDEIIIPIIDEHAVDLGLVFYNYPLDKDEASHLDKESIAINHILLLKDVDEYIPVEEPKEDLNIDPKAKKAQAPPKDNKNANNELAMFQKNFSPPPKSSDDIFYELKLAKYHSDKSSLLRMIYFDIWDFTSKSQSNAPSSAGGDENAKKDPFSNFVDVYGEKLNSFNKYLIYFQKWSLETSVIKLNDYSNDPAMQRNINESLIQKLFTEADIKKKDFEHMSMGAVLISFYIDLVKHMREINHIGEHNMIIYEKNDVDNLFDNLEKEIIYEYSADTRSTQNEEHNMSSHMIIEQQKEIEKHEAELYRIDELSSYFKLIIDEKDLILKNALDNEIEKFRLGEREKAFNLFRKFPGIGRNFMPDVPPKEENFRKAKKCEIYPFLDHSIGIPLYEKYDIIKKFEEIVKEKITEYNFDFGDRIYQEIMNRDLLSQTLNHAMIFDTDILYQYNERDDNLLFSTYYRCPKGRIYRKTNRYKYLSKPHFDNWIKFFKPTFNEKVHRDVNNNNEINASLANSKPGTPFGNNSSHIPVPNAQNDISQQGFHNDMSNPEITNNFGNGPSIKIDKKPEIVFGNGYDAEKDLLYDADDIFLGEVTEKIKYMFPSDNGVFIKKVIENGIFKTFNSYVLKDNLIYGIKKNSENIPEFWLKFDNDVIMTVNYIGNYDSYQENYDSKNGTYTSFTFKNGLTVEILPNGDICQKIETLDDNLLIDRETHRIITSKASIISHFKMNKTKVLYANGNVCNIQGGTSVNTNNKGYRVAKRLQDNFEYEMEPVAITIQSDPETNTKTLIRDDKVMSIKYPDNSMLTIHDDNTRIFTFSDHLKYLVEHENFASCEIRYDPVKKRTKTIISEGSSDALLGNDDLMTRSYDGRLSKIEFPDKTIVFTYKEKKATEEFDKFTFNTINLIYRPDGTVIRIQQDGDIVMVSAKERIKFNTLGQNLPDGNDTDYLFEINGKPEDRRGGVYSVDMKKEKIYTKDTEKNIFELHSDGSAKSKLSVTLDLDNSHKTIDEIRPDSPRYSGESYIDPEAIHLEAPKNFIHPRLFVIENDNSGYELLNEDQITNFKLNKQKDVLHSKYINQEMETYFRSHYWITKYLSVSELISETHFINKIKIPKKLEKITQTPLTLQFPPKEIYLYRNLIESVPFDEDFRQKISISIENRDNWFAKRKLDFGFVDISNLPELKDNFLIQKRILDERQKSDLKFDNEIIKNQFIMELQSYLNPSELNLLKNKSILFDISQFLEERNKKKIIEDMSFRVMPLNINNLDINELINNVNMDEMRNSRKSKIVSDVKANQEIHFTDNYFFTDIGRSIMELHPRGNIVKKKKNNSLDDGFGSNLIACDTDDKYFSENTKKSEKDINNNMDDFGLINELNHKADDFDNEDLNQNQNLISPIVYLDEDKNQNSKGISKSKSKTKMKKTLPSIHKRTLEIVRQKAKNEVKQGEKWHEIKNYKYSVDGKSPRRENPKIPNYLKTTFPEAEFNEDYIYIEKMTDKRIKTSSVANRLYFNAPSINMIRKSGQHNFLLEALDKKKTYEEMMERLNLMITSELCDPLNKMLKVEPTSLEFGNLKMGHKYEMNIKIRNDDNITNRVQIRKSSDNKNIGIELFIGGKLTPGQTKKIKITINANENSLGKITEEIQIQTKSFIYKIPVNAYLVTNEEYEKLEAENLQKLGKRLHTNAKIYIKEIPKELLSNINMNMLNNIPNTDFPNFQNFNFMKTDESHNNSNYEIDASLKLPKINS